jgi:phosphatidylglycerol:prolipoprotein diacylglycerol transferase
MYPKLFTIGSFSLHTYGLMVALGFLASLLIVKRESALYKLPGDYMSDTAMWGVIAGLVGARILYIITRLSEFMAHPMEMFKIWNGGIVWYGGMIAGAAVVIWRAKRVKFPILLVLDVCSPAAVLGHAIGRLGCFFTGYYYGKPTTMPWGVAFHSPDTIASPRGTPLHPTQLYMFIEKVIIFACLIAIRKYWKGTGAESQKKNGLVIASYLMLYAIGRSIVEVYRGDSIRGFVVENLISTSQFISIFMFLAGLILMLVVLRRGGKSKRT